MLSADVAKGCGVISNKHTSAFRWLQGAVTVSRQKCPVPDNLRGLFQVQKERQGNVKETAILNQTITYLGWIRNGRLYFSRAPYSVEGRRDSREPLCPEAGEGKQSKGPPTSNIGLFCGKAASLFRASAFFWPERGIKDYPLKALV